jgi:hypothetical protein
MHIMVKNLNELKNRYLLWTVSELERGKAFPQPSSGKKVQHNSTNLPFFEPIFAQLLPEGHIFSLAHPSPRPQIT